MVTKDVTIQLNADELENGCDKTETLIDEKAILYGALISSNVNGDDNHKNYSIEINLKDTSGWNAKSSVSGPYSLSSSIEKCSILGPGVLSDLKAIKDALGEIGSVRFTRTDFYFDNSDNIHLGNLWWYSDTHTQSILSKNIFNDLDINVKTRPVTYRAISASITINLSYYPVLE